jgi:hypothetical protein
MIDRALERDSARLVPRGCATRNQTSQSGRGVVVDDSLVTGHW